MLLHFKQTKKNIRFILQEKTLFLRIDTKAGHGAGKPTSMIIDEYTDKFAYASEVMNLEWHD